ncbi:unnamed protein product [Thlaspi arvense]|uniref:FCP1 homology domain-containing protein n=1 Tax=Thlaspi arvense TaxID=13288 RepID=A0AAU9T3W1_THLAR|nr:unnamed protein product [Thlaspi arvense]
MANLREPQSRCVFVETNLETHLGVLLNNNDTSSDFKENLCKEHMQCFPEIGEIEISAVKVKRRDQFYHCSDSVILSLALAGIRNWYIYVDLSVKATNKKCSENELLEREKEIAIDGTKDLTIEDALEEVAEKKSKEGKLKSSDESDVVAATSSRYNADESQELCGKVQVASESCDVEKLNEVASESCDVEKLNDLKRAIDLETGEELDKIGLEKILAPTLALVDAHITLRDDVNERQKVSGEVQVGLAAEHCVISPTYDLVAGAIEKNRNVQDNLQTAGNQLEANSGLSTEKKKKRRKRPSKKNRINRSTAGVTPAKEDTLVLIVEEDHNNQPIKVVGDCDEENVSKDLASKAEVSEQKMDKKGEVHQDAATPAKEDTLVASGAQIVEEAQKNQPINGETVGKDLASKAEVSEQKNDKKGGVHHDALGAESVDKVEVKTKKRKKKKKKMSDKKKPCDDMLEKTDGVSIPMNEEKPQLDGKTSLPSSVLIHNNVEVETKKRKRKSDDKKKTCDDDHETGDMDEKTDNLSVPRNEKKPELEVVRSLSSSVLKLNNLARGMASLGTRDSPRCTCQGQRIRKLVVLDLNGILADIVQGYRGSPLPDGIISDRAVFKRPFVARFLDFCFERFDVGIWSSRRIGLDYMAYIVMGNHAKNVTFCFDQHMCTTTKFNTLEKSSKPIFLKDLRRVWDRFGTCHTCGRGKYNERNTLLVDDSPHKALCNPPYTGIFPCPYQYTNRKDSELGPNGELRKYLERLADVDNVQEFVAENPFGQTAITERHESWEFYSKVIEAYK